MPLYRREAAYLRRQGPGRDNVIGLASITRNGMTFNAVAQNDIDGRLWLREGHILYHSTGYKIGVIEQVLKVAGRR